MYSVRSCNWTYRMSFRRMLLWHCLQWVWRNKLVFCRNFLFSVSCSVIGSHLKYGSFHRPVDVFQKKNGWLYVILYLFDLLFYDSFSSGVSKRRYHSRHLSRIIIFSMDQSLFVFYQPYLFIFLLHIKKEWEIPLLNTISLTWKASGRAKPRGMRRRSKE